MSRHDSSRLLLLLVALLASVVYSTRLPVASYQTRCSEYGRLSSRPLADVYVVDLDSAVTRAFFRYARCWLPQRGRLRIFDEEDDYSQIGVTSVEFVMSNLSRNRTFLANFERNLTTNGTATTRYGYTLLQPCDPDKCDRDDWKMEQVGKDFCIVNTYAIGYRDSFGMILTGVKNPLLSGAPTSEAFDKQSYDQMVRLGLMVVLVTFFTLLAIAICCHSLWIISMVYDDFDWRRENQDNVVFRVLDEEPMRSPEPTMGLQTAMSRTNSNLTARSRSSVSDYTAWNRTELDGTQFSRTEKTAMED